MPATDLAIRGTLHSVDQYLNIKLLSVSVDDTETFPHMVRRMHVTASRWCRAADTCLARTLAQQSVKVCFVRGSVIKYVQLPASEVDTELLQDATRREAAQQKAGK